MLKFDGTNESINEEYINKYIEWQKQFVNGKQNTLFNEVICGPEEMQKRFYWQEEEVFNLLKPIVDRWIEEYDKDKIWGINKAVDQLIPYQRQYNNLMNTVKELTCRIASPILCVEDGSVDCDELGEEGLAPGKMIVYRQGSQAPSQISPAANDITALYGVALGIKTELMRLAEDLEENF